MAKSINKTYYPNATATCQNCQSSYTLGMTVEKLSLEICGNCHPFYTGQETMVDTAGRIEKFQNRISKANSSEKKSKVKTRRTQLTLADLNKAEEAQVQ